MPGWDNTARRGGHAYVFHGANSLSWRALLARTVQGAGVRGQTVFINAWNEWAEGASLEGQCPLGIELGLSSKGDLSSESVEGS